MTSVGTGGNYISDGEIMAWLAEQQNRLYGDMRDSIDLAQERADFSTELNNVKAELQAANQARDFTQVSQHIRGVLMHYSGREGFDKLTEGLYEIANTLHGASAPQEKYAADLEEYWERRNEYTAAGGTGGPVTVTDAAGNTKVLRIPVPPRNPGPPPAFDDKTIDAWLNQIGGTMDAVNKNDQLAMIHIQELKATIDQSSQLASSLISSGDKTSSAIIHNIA